MASDQFVSAVASRPWTSRTVGAPTGPCAIRMKAWPRPGRSIMRPSGNSSAKCRSAISSRSMAALRRVTGRGFDVVLANISVLLQPLVGADGEERSGRPVRLRSEPGLDQVADLGETFLSSKSPGLGGFGGLLELPQAVDEAPHAVRTAVEVGRPAEADAGVDGEVAADPADVVEVEDLARLRVQLELRGRSEEHTSELQS